MLSPDDVATLARAGRKQPLFDRAAVPACALGRAEIERLLPHRAPMLLVDAITGVDLDGRRIVGRRALDADDPGFRGHFPGDPIYPGVLQLETMGQLGLCLLGLGRKGRAVVTDDDRPAPARALKIHHAIFLAEVRPGADLTVLGHVIDHDDYLGVCSAQIWHGDRLCAFAIMEVYFVDES
jgi:3-hydroxymyristoyl/3-hydroxydecanoyl-(acyl carrier protein) dehydratase